MADRSLDPLAPLGATLLPGGGCRFNVWAPNAARAEVRMLGEGAEAAGEHEGILHPMAAVGNGYHQAVIDGVQAGARYYYRLDGERQRPDPASRAQPEGVHGPSRVESDAFDWHDQHWRGLPLEQHVQYEVHTGAFTEEGTFAAIISHLDDLMALGVTALELMPVAQFPGGRNWGYDGTYPFAVQDSYGGTQGLKQLVDACHGRGLAVLLDVVYNHLGPEGNYLWDFGPYFTEKYHTPWGAAVNVDGPHSDEVRRYFIENALRWIEEFHLDGLRLDAAHAIYDQSARPFLAELAARVQERAAALGRHVHLIAESNLNDPKLIRPAAAHGYGLAAQWADDLHHAVHSLLTGERDGYYADFGGVEPLVRAYRDGYSYTGAYSMFRKRRHGAPTGDLPGRCFVVCSQNHDQTGNRALGERLSTLVPFAALKTAAAAVLLSPFVPLLFMGEEYGETAPFLYFTSHSDPALIAAVRHGRREEFASFVWSGELPEPDAEETFARSRLRHSWQQAGGGSRSSGQDDGAADCGAAIATARGSCAGDADAPRPWPPARHAALRAFYQECLRLRREVPALRALDRTAVAAWGLKEGRLVLVHRRHPQGDALLLLHFAAAPLPLPPSLLPAAPGGWRLALDAAAQQWHGPGSTLPARVELADAGPLTLPPWGAALFLAGAR